MPQTRLLAAALLASFIAGCATDDDPNRQTKTGAAIGALIGAAIGNQTSDNRTRGTVVGAVVGALAGGAVGTYMDKQQKELEDKLKAEQDAKLLNIQRLPDNSLKVGVASEATFDVNAANLKINAEQTFAKISGVLKDYDKTVIHVIGHTDSTGSDSYNQQLSERRAQSVSGYMSSQGVPSNRLLTEGRGEREPVASNADADGRRLNRRVDIVIKPVVEGNEQAAYEPPQPSR